MVYKLVHMTIYVLEVELVSSFSVLERNCFFFILFKISQLYFFKNTITTLINVSINNRQIDFILAYVLLNIIYYVRYKK